MVNCVLTLQLPTLHSPIGSSPDKFAFLNITILKALMNCSTDDQRYISLNGAVHGRTVEGNSANTTISLQFNYDPSGAPIEVNVLATNAVPEFSLASFAASLMLATLAVALVGKTALSRKRKT